MFRASGFLVAALCWAPAAFAIQGANPDLSGLFQIKECNPKCETIELNLGFGIQHQRLEKGRNLEIHVIDRSAADHFTCDNHKYFAFRILLSLRRVNVPIEFNNAKKPSKSHHQVCDGDFASDSNHASLKSKKVKLTFRRKTDEYELYIEDARLEFTAMIKMVRINLDDQDEVEEAEAV
ncbi:MAG: hypothetical protein C5B49_01780 [Bdellovibrio sp.]|nr:MAG: hypothetical protein C5B49_01780 [Bdellovibrio sp.]